MTASFELQGHRGARGLFPENTIEGFLDTIALGVSSLELDIAVTADGVPVVAHDPALHPDIARGPDGAWGALGLIRSMTLAEVQTYDVGRLRPGSRLAGLYPDQVGRDGVRIPTLADLFAATAASAMVLDVELKTDPAHPDHSVSPAEMAEAVMRVAREEAGLDRLVVRSFDWRGLAVLQRTHHGVKLAWLTTGQTRPDDVLQASGGVGIWAPAFADLSAHAVSAAHAGGLRVVPWTVNAADDMARLIGWGVDGLCTDRPDIARTVMSAHGLPLPPGR